MTVEPKCSNCIFAVRFEMPTQKPEKTGYGWGSALQHALNMDLYNSAVESHLTKIRCNRFPNSIIKSKDSFCGEFKENG